jgi:hypothetical protein
MAISMAQNRGDAAIRLLSKAKPAISSFAGEWGKSLYPQRRPFEVRFPSPSGCPDIIKRNRYE